MRDQQPNKALEPIGIALCRFRRRWCQDVWFVVHGFLRCRGSAFFVRRPGFAPNLVVMRGAESEPAHGVTRTIFERHHRRQFAASPFAACGRRRQNFRVARRAVIGTTHAVRAPDMFRLAHSKLVAFVVSQFEFHICFTFEPPNQSPDAAPRGAFRLFERVDGCLESFFISKCCNNRQSL